MIGARNYTFSEVTKNYVPTLYPGEKSSNWVLPKELQSDFSKLNSIIENKYSREFLKICAFYNKMFPSLKTGDWTRSTYNVQPFTTLDQERNDTGTGISSNYLKQIIDQVTSRLGTIKFEPKLLADEPTLEYIVYKDEVERILKKVLRLDNFNKKMTEIFHDTAVLGYSHVFVDPYTGSIKKANDYEVGIYESEFNDGQIMHFVYRDYNFPVIHVPKYLLHCEDKTKEKVLAFLKGKSSVDFKLFIDAVMHSAYVVVGGIVCEPIEYPYDKVLMCTFRWDTGFSAVLTTSLFDLLYPVQREVNKIKAKQQQLMRMYKGPLPIFNNDVDLAMKNITNGTGECLYINSARPVESLVTVINPTPLDPELSAMVTELKTEMYELAGIQQVSFDMENMRSAAAVIALDQTRDTVFQAQLQGMADFCADVLKMYVEFMSAGSHETEINSEIDWSAVLKLLNTAQVDLKPVHLNDPLGNEDAADITQEPDYQQLQISRVLLRLMKGTMDYSDIPYFVDKQQLLVIAATYLVKFTALNIDVPDNLHLVLINGFIDGVQKGEIVL